MTTAQFATSPIAAVNVACVPQRSPLRYPGGKTWLIPHVRYWLTGQTAPPARAGTERGDCANDRPQLAPRGAAPPARPRLLVEPFAGGGIVSLTAVMEGLAERCLLAELDEDVAAFWCAALRSSRPLQARVRGFQPTREAVHALASSSPSNVLDRGFRTLVLNRTRRGGILAPGASLSRRGENGKGVASRWYPETTVRRLAEVEKYAERIDFRKADGLELLASVVGPPAAPSETSGIFAFVDPPYTAGGKRAGSRLYRHNEIDHARLFRILADSTIDFLMTYDCAPEIVSLVREHGFHAVQVATLNTHHARVPELLITRRRVFGRSRRGRLDAEQAPTAL